MRITRKLSLLAFLPAFASAGEWYVYGRAADDQSFLYVDVSSITTHGPGKRAWFQGVRPDGSAQAALYAFRCASREAASVARREWDREGRLARTGKADRLVYAPVRPDTVAADMLAIACAANPRELIAAEMGGAPVEGDPREHARRVRAEEAAARATP